MCGILCLLSLNNKSSQIPDELKKILENRGPDIKASFTEFNSLLSFFGFVLWQQGEKAFTQPAISEQYALLLNGDIYNADKNSSISDTEWLLLELSKCCTDNDIIDFLRKLEGPYSIIFYNRQLNILYFARDPLGRNSLLIERDILNDCIQISSTSTLSSNNNNICIELPPIGIYRIKLIYDCNNNILNFNNVELYLWKNILPDQKKNIENIFQVPLIENLDNGRINIKHLQNRIIEKYFNFYDIVQNNEVQMSSLLENESISGCVDEVIVLLKNSLRDRILNTPKFCAYCITENITCEHSKIGILFSGGLDCSIIAKLSDEFCNKEEPIDLLNVAFENVNCKNKENIDWNTPDRITALKSYEELCTLVPQRNWNLIQVNVTRKELSSYLSTNIKHLIYPLNTILDESLGASFWFASRGIGSLKGNEYQTTCRVILIGSGADEMFGGYTRHRNAFTRTHSDLSSKINAVGKELKMDWERIAFRNLGRDDRVIADNRKTARSPYIEENLVQFVNNLKPEQKCCFILSQGIGDKLLLRLCGFKLGLNYSSILPKRAIQFGSKIADKKQNATDVSKYLVHLN